jgi:hypothetical protein
MNWYRLVPTNKYVYIGFGLMLLGFLTLPFLIGLLIMPIGILFLVFGIHKAFYDTGKGVYDFFKKFKKNKDN